MSLLVKLPDDVTIVVLTKFCNFTDLNLIDDAYCNEKERSKILALFQLPYYVMESLNCWDFNNVHHFVLRNIKVKVLYGLNNRFFDILSQNELISNLL